MDRRAASSNAVTGTGSSASADSGSQREQSQQVSSSRSSSTGPQNVESGASEQGEDGFDELVHLEEEQIAEEGELAERMRELSMLQHQLEGLEQVTASLQAVASQMDRPSTDGAGAGIQVQRTRDSRRSRRLLGLTRQRRTGDDEEDEEQQVHPHVTCDGCRSGPPLTGRVMHCQECEDYDLCARCFDEHSRGLSSHDQTHHFEPRAPVPRRAAPSQFLLNFLENAMLGEALRRSVEVDNSREEEAARTAARGAEVLAQLPRQAWSPSLQHDKDCDNTECALCLEEYEHGEEVLQLPCGGQVQHVFHERCLRPWFAKSLLCPLCQQEAVAAPIGEQATPQRS